MEGIRLGLIPRLAKSGPRAAGAAQGQRGERQAEDEREDDPSLAHQLQMTPELLRKFGAMSGKFAREREIGESALMGHQRKAGRERAAASMAPRASESPARCAPFSMASNATTAMRDP